MPPLRFVPVAQQEHPLALNRRRATDGNLIKSQGVNGEGEFFARASLTGWYPGTRYTDNVNTQLSGMSSMKNLFKPNEEPF